MGDYYDQVPMKYRENPKLVAKWATMGKTARARVTQGHHTACTKCASDFTQHNSGICQACRTIVCVKCNRKLTVKYKLWTHCGTCKRNEREKLTELDQGAMA